VLEVRDLTRHTPVCGIIRRILEQIKAPISCDELTVHVLEAWQRSFPPNPYEDCCMVYKLAGSFRDVELHYDDLTDIPMIIEEGNDPVLVTPQLGADDLNRALDQIKRIKFSLKRG
jgi:hypothetical protein